MIKMNRSKYLQTFALLSKQKYITYKFYNLLVV